MVSSMTPQTAATTVHAACFSPDIMSVLCSQIYALLVMHTISPVLPSLTSSCWMGCHSPYSVYVQLQLAFPVSELKIP